MYTRINTWNRGDKSITLIGCCHIGTREYYAKIQSYLNEFYPSEVLYEGVSGDGDPSMKVIMKLYKKIASITEWVFQHDGICYSDKWTNSDLTKDILVSAKGGNLFDIKTDEIEEEWLNDVNRKSLMTLIRFAFKLRWAFGLFGKDDSIILDLRNSKCVIDTFEKLSIENRCCILYGEAHLKGIEKFIRSVGFKKTSTVKLRPFDNN